jgi:hypothetical protein
MIAAGIGLVLIGYALLYSGASNLVTGGKGYGFLKSLTGKDVSLTGTSGGQGEESATALFSSITTQTPSTPNSNNSPVSGVQQV